MKTRRPAGQFDSLPEEVLVLILQNLNFFTLNVLRSSCLFFLLDESVLNVCKQKASKNFSLIGYKGYRYIIVADMLWSCGNSEYEYGQLGHVGDTSSFKKIEQNFILKSGGVHQVFPCLYLMAVLCNNGNLFLLGENSSGPVGAGHNRAFLKAGGIKKTVTRYDGIAVLCHDGTVFFVGYGIILGSHHPDQFFPVNHDLLKQAGGIKDLCLSDCLMALVGMNDEVFVIVGGSYSFRSIYKVTEGFFHFPSAQFKNGGGIKQITSNGDSIFVLCANGQLHVVGKDNYGECGRRVSGRFWEDFSLVLSDEIQLSGGIREILLHSMRFTVLLGNKGGILCSGWNGGDLRSSHFMSAFNHCIAEGDAIKKMLCHPNLLQPGVFLLTQRGLVFRNGVDCGLKNIIDITSDVVHFYAVDEQGVVFSIGKAASLFSKSNDVYDKIKQLKSRLDSQVENFQHLREQPAHYRRSTPRNEGSTQVRSLECGEYDMLHAHPFARLLVSFLESEIYFMGERIKKRNQNIHFNLFQASALVSSGKVKKFQMVLLWMQEQTILSDEVLQNVKQFIYSICALKRNSNDPRRAKSRLRFELSFKCYGLPGIPYLNAEELKEFQEESDIPKLLDTIQFRIEHGQENRRGCVMQ